MYVTKTTGEQINHFSMKKQKKTIAEQTFASELIVTLLCINLPVKMTLLQHKGMKVPRESEKSNCNEVGKRL